MTQPQATSGHTVRIHYDGFLQDGTLFGSSRLDEPVEFTIGESRLIPAFERAVIGMSEGEKKTVFLPAQEAFGEHREELVRTVDKAELPPHIDPVVGKILVIHADQGEDVRAVITDVTDESLTIDANHPLAGKEVTFEIELLEIKTQ